MATSNNRMVSRATNVSDSVLRELPLLRSQRHFLICKLQVLMMKPIPRLNPLYLLSATQHLKLSFSPQRPL